MPDHGGRLFAISQEAPGSDDVYTPSRLFDRLGIRFDLDVAAPPGGVEWVPADRFYTLADDGLTAPWSGRVWMNPPYSDVWPWVRRFVDHAHGITLLPFAKSHWLNLLWATVDGIALPDRMGSFVWANGRTTWQPVFLAAFGQDCVQALSRLGPVR